MAKKPRKQVHLPPAVCTEEFKERVQDMADYLDRSMSWIIIRALEQYMKDFKKATEPPEDENKR